ncbi:MAG: DapH/DapD/GlmU-related protein [Propionicimonas sp.]
MTGPVLVRGRGDIVVGDDVVLDAADGPIELFALDGARIELGRGAYVGPGASIEAGESVWIGPGARLGAFAKILDNNWHGSGANRDEVPESSPVVVGARARLGTRATMLPGSSLGERSVLRDDSVLSRQAPKDVQIAGVPARLVGNRDAAAQALPMEPDSTTTNARPHVWPLAIAADAPAIVGKPTMLWLSAREGASHLPGPALPLVKKLERVVTLASAHYQLRSAVRIRRAFVCGRLDVLNKGHLEVGDDVVFDGGPLRSRIEVGPGAELTIGDRVISNYGVFIRAEHSVRIGARCMLGSRVAVLDRHGDVSGPVVIEDDVWLAHGATVLPGVTIGKGSAVSAGALVDKDVPPGSLAFGSPVRFRPVSAIAKAH